MRKAISDWSQGDLEAAMLHACNAVDGTAKKVYAALGNKERFTRLLRENYGILGPMGVPGINVVDTRFPVTVQRATAPGGQPDLADLIYAVHRCAHGHGDELPDGFELIQNAAGPEGYTRMEMQRGKVHLSDRIIFGLLAVAVLSPANKGQRVPDSYYLSFGRSARMLINQWWGRAADFPAIVASEPPTPNVTMDFKEWMP